MARTLHDGPTRRGIAPHDQGKADDPFPADNRHFRRSAVRHYIEKRNDACRREMDMSQTAPRLIKNFPKRHRHVFDLGQQWLTLNRRDCCQEQIPQSNSVRFAWR
jgi:hypothetical protein